jgi:hypothetical protein
MQIMSDVILTTIKNPINTNEGTLLIEESKAVENNDPVNPHHFRFGDVLTHIGASLGGVSFTTLALSDKMCPSEKGGDQFNCRIAGPLTFGILSILVTFTGVWLNNRNNS